MVVSLPKIDVIQSTPSLSVILSIAGMNANIIPNITNTYELGSASYILKNIFTNKISFYDTIGNYSTISRGTGETVIELRATTLTFHNLGASIAQLDSTGGFYAGNNLIANNNIYSISSGDLGTTTYKIKDIHQSGNFKPAYTNYFLHEIYEHCNTSIAEIRTTDNSEKIINRLIHGCSVITNITSSKYRLTSGGAIGNACYEYLPILHNPSDYTYYSSSFKGLFESLTMQNELLFSVSDTNNDYFAKIEIGTNAGTIKCTTTADAGVSTTTTDNITCDITALHEYKINIKNGTIKFYVDNVEIASHTTNIFYNVTIGVYPIVYWETAENGAHYQEIDYMIIQLGRVF